MKKQIEKLTGLKVVSLTMYKGARCVKLSMTQFLEMSAEQSATIEKICGKNSWITCG